MPISPKLPTSSNIGLKEWSVTSKALSQGEQIFMLRKGGIREDSRHFKIEHRQFLLYPGVFHEATSLLKPKYHSLISGTANEDFIKKITLSVFCELIETIDISQENQLNALDPFHIWSKSFPVKRFKWKPRQPLKLMIVRAYKLNEAITIPVIPAYKGCKSWVKLVENIKINDLEPALSDKTFSSVLAKIHDNLKTQTSRV